MQGQVLGKNSAASNQPGTLAASRGIQASFVIVLDGTTQNPLSFFKYFIV